MGGEEDVCGLGRPAVERRSKPVDERFVDGLTRGLGELGYDVWRDLDDIPPVADWRDEIELD